MKRLCVAVRASLLPRFKLASLKLPPAMAVVNYGISSPSLILPSTGKIYEPPLLPRARRRVTTSTLAFIIRRESNTVVFPILSIFCFVLSLRLFSLFSTAREFRSDSVKLHFLLRGEEMIMKTRGKEVLVSSLRAERNDIDLDTLRCLDN